MAEKKKMPSTEFIGENLFNPPMKLDRINEWFMQLAGKESQNGGFYLTKEEVGQFINRAFCGNKSIPMPAANLGNGDVDTMIALFLIFYEQCKNLGYARKGDLRKYVGLLTENFTNYNHLSDSLPTNFTKYGARRNAWPNTGILL